MPNRTSCGKKARCRIRSGFPVIFFNALVLSLPLAGQVVHADAGADTATRRIDMPAPDGSGQSGFYLSAPVYLYGRYSALGVQLGWQKGNLHLRMDLSVINEVEKGEEVFFAIPSLGAFYSQEWEARIRSYEGITIGVETGLLNAFEGQVCTVNVLMGAEWFVFKRQAIYIELGSGVGIMPKEGAFNGGTVIGGGLKYFL